MLSPENERKAKLEQSQEPEKPRIVHYADENREPGTSEPRVGLLAVPLLSFILGGWIYIKENNKISNYLTHWPLNC